MTFGDTAAPIRAETSPGEADPARGEAMAVRQLGWIERAPRFIAILSGAGHVFEYANAAYARLVGDRDLLGVTVRDAFPELHGQGFFEVLDGVLMTGRRYVAHNIPVTLVNQGRPTHRLLDFTYEPILDDDGRPVGIFVDGQDVTDAGLSQAGDHQIQRRQALLVELNDRLRDLETPAELSFAAAELLGTALGVSRAGYGTIRVADETITIERDWNAEGIQSLAGTLRFRDYGTYIEELKRGETVVCADAFVDPRTADRAEALKAISAQAFVNMPVSEQGGLVALLYLNHAKARVWTPEELALIREVAERTRVAVERRRAELALQQSETRLRLAVDAARMAIWAYDVAQQTLQPSPELNVMLGYAPEARLDLQDIQARYHEDDRDAVRDAARAAIAAGDRFFEAQHRFLRPDGEWRWFLIRAEILFEDGDAPSGVVGVILDVTARKAAEQRLSEREADLKAALDAGSLAPFEFDHLAGVMAPSPRLNLLYGYPPDHVLTLRDMRDRYHPDDRAAFLEQARAHQAEADLKPFQWELRLLMPDGFIRWIEGRGQYERSRSGQIHRSRGVILDITARKKSEERQRLLVNELNHRVKNTLAIVQGLAQQSFRRKGDPDRARAAFEARLSALSGAHNLLTRNSWEPASITDVVEGALLATVGEDADRVDRSGPQLRVPPQTAVSIALALHELSTNAIKYGALSEPGGRIRIRWETYSDQERLRFRLVWTERGGPPVRPPQSRGFGSRMIEHGLASDLGGTAALSFEPEGVVYTIDAPLPE